MVIEPATEPVTDSEATPPTAVEAPSPVTVPVPPVFANVIEVALSEVTRLPTPSRTSAVRVRAEPEARFAVELVTTMSVGPFVTTAKVVEPADSPLAVAPIVIDPTDPPVTDSDATPALAVAAPSPVTVPAPEVLAKVTEVELSALTRLPAASRTSAVSVRDVAAVRLPVELVIVRWSAAPGSTVKVVVSEVSPLADAVSVIEPATAPVMLFEATPLTAVAEPAPVTVPAPADLAKV